MAANSRMELRAQADDEYDFEEEHDDEDFFSDDILTYTDLMRDFEDK